SQQQRTTQGRQPVQGQARPSGGTVRTAGGAVKPVGAAATHGGGVKPPGGPAKLTSGRTTQLVPLKGSGAAQISRRSNGTVADIHTNGMTIHQGVHGG